MVRHVVRHVLADGTEKAYEYERDSWRPKRLIQKVCSCGVTFKTQRKTDHAKCIPCRDYPSWAKARGPKQVKPLLCQDCQAAITGSPGRRYCDECRMKRRRSSWKGKAKRRLLANSESISPGRLRNRDGYVYVNAPAGHPRWLGDGRIGEHRLVVEQQIGRYLEPRETVHHKNGVRDDNRPENLELWSKNHRAGVRVSDLVADVVRLYPELVRAELRRQTTPKKVVPINEFQTSLFDEAIFMKKEAIGHGSEAARRGSSRQNESPVLSGADHMD